MTLITQHFDSLSTDLMRLNYTANEISEGLHTQTHLLRIRNLGLPDDVLEQAAHLSNTLDGLAYQLEEDHRELAQLRALAHTAALINSTLELEEVLARAMDTVIGLTDAERGYIMLSNDETGEMEFMVGRKIGRESVEAGQFIISRGIVGEVISTGEPIVTTNAQEDDRFNTHESVMSYALRSILCVPLLNRDRVIGVVYADNRVKQAIFGDRELQLLVSFANQAAIAIQNAQLFERVKARLNEVSERRQLLDSIFASIASGIVTTNMDGQVRTISPVAGQILSVDDQSVGQPLTTVLPSVYEGFEEVLEHIQDQDSRENVELSTVIPERGPVTLSLKLSPLKGDASETMGVAVVLDDLTNIKQRDETLNVIRTYLSDEMVSNIQSIESLGLSGVEREITVMNADVRGFTTFSERLAPEKVLEIINQYLTTSSNAIQYVDGIIDKYMGDAVVGMFNTQLNPCDDHPLRAVRAALAVFRDVQHITDTPETGQRLAFGIGIHTGMAVLGNVGSPSRKEFTALGDAITVSKKLQETAQPGEIIISEETYQAVQDSIDAEKTQRQLRGSNETMNVYCVLGEK